MNRYESPFLAAALELDDAEVARRFGWARRGGHPMWVWPEVDPGAWRAGLAAIEDALQARLGGAASVGLQVSPGGEAGLAIAAYSSGTGALLGRWWEEGLLEAGVETGRLLALHLEHGRRRWTRLRAVSGHAVEVLAGIGLSPILLKGIHTSAAFFPEPACRPCNDVDLAVPAGDWGRAAAALELAGYVPITRQHGLGKVELLPPGEGSSLRSLHLLHADAPIRLDLHGGLDRHFFGAGRLELGEPAAGESGPWPAIHPAARVLREPLLLATLAANASEGLHNLTLIRLYELALVIRQGRAHHTLDWDALLGRVRPRDRRFLFPALEMTERLAPGTVPAQVRSALRAEAPPALRRVVDALRPAAAQRMAQLSIEERLMWVGTPGELAGRLADMAWPASAGGSWRGVARIYAERLWRMARGRVSLAGD